MDLKKDFKKIIDFNLPRILTHLCRDEDNPAFGSFDRYFWHYKMRDFPSMVLQQAIMVLDLYVNKKIELPSGYQNYHLLEKWRTAALHFWMKSQNRNGSFDEYYPFESGFPPTAFSLYAVSSVLKENEINEEVLRALTLASRFILKKTETQAANQEIIGLTGCSIAASLGADLNTSQLSARWDRLFKSQSSEGWFNEYDGPDTGYLSVACDALWDYFDLSNDQRGYQAVKNAAVFIDSLIAPDGKLPLLINSRNTNYIVPYGLVRISKTEVAAESALYKIFKNINSPGHFIYSIDDRYLLHYNFTSLYRSYPYLSALSETNVNFHFEKWYGHSGIYVNSNEKQSIHISASKGGSVVRTDSSGNIKADLGFRSRVNNKIITTNWLEPESSVKYEKLKDRIIINIKMPLRYFKFTLPTPAKHILLRIISRVFGNKLIPFLKNRIIFNYSKSRDYFERTIVIEGDRIKILNKFTGKTNFDKKEGYYSMRHVSSAGQFNFCELDQEISPRSIETEYIF